MLKTLNWYIAKNFLYTFAMAMGILVFGMTGARLIKVFNYISNGVSVGVAFSFMLYVLPMTLAFTIPWAALVSIMLVFGRLSADNEITAMRACGVSILQIVSPIITICFLLTCCCLYLQLELGPRWLGKARDVIKHVAVNQPLAMFEPGIPTEFDEFRILIDRKETVTWPLVRKYVAEAKNRNAHYRENRKYTLPVSRFQMNTLTENEYFTNSIRVLDLGGKDRNGELKFAFSDGENQGELLLLRKNDEELVTFLVRENNQLLLAGKFDSDLLPATVGIVVSKTGRAFLAILPEKVMGRGSSDARIRTHELQFTKLFLSQNPVWYRLHTAGDFVNADEYLAGIAGVRTYGIIYGVQFTRMNYDKLKRNISLEQDISAARGRIVTDDDTKIMHIILENATIISYEKNGEMKPRRTFGREISFDIDYGKEFNSERISKRDKHESFRQLYARSIIERERGSRLRITEIETELNQRVALALAPIAFLLLGLPLAIRTSRRETSIGLFLSVILAVGYFMGVLVSDTFNSTPNAYPQYLVWIPPALYEIFGAFYLFKIARN